jgi:Ni/Fe-hydrogenase 1 B-type cytochrome subunit
MFPEPKIKRVRVWSGAVRFSHWVIAATTTLLLLSGLVLGSGLYGDLAPFVTAHVTAGYLLVLALGWRLYLLFFGEGTANWRDCIPDAAQRRAARAMVVFLLTWTRSPPPVHYGHNPLWGPVYLAMFAIISLQAAVGLLLHVTYYQQHFLSVIPWVYEAPLPEWHRLGFVIIGAFAVLHVISVFLQDWKGSAGEVSAMINGSKTFIVDPAAIDVNARLKEMAGSSDDNKS